ncbi:Kdo2-lipid IVA 3' secondary acyltransferase [Nitratiruptor sp. YY09-18]|nr:Kdo2-lipid IVA 3' secondary acyltransferase [Nitratiruptor sp. YY09-18]
MRLLYATCKKEFKIEGGIPQEPCIIAFWHGELLMHPFLYQKLRPNHKIAAMISEHFDGELIARTIAYFGFDAIRGSSRKGGAKALIAAFRKIKEGYDIAITPDGPRGPRHSVAPGIVALAKKSNAPIVIFHYEASKCWQLKSWDRFIIPKPFSKITFFVKKPFKINSFDDNKAKAFIQEKMLQF